MNRLLLNIALVVLALVAPLRLAAQASAEDYTLGTRDALYINVWGHPGMESEVIVSGKGTIHYFLVGDVYVEGLTLPQAREKLAGELSSYIRNPVLEMKITEYNSKEVQILGAVDTPGPYVLQTNYTTVIRLISKAKGVTADRGNKGYIYKGGADELKDILAKERRRKEEEDPDNEQRGPISSDAIGLKLREMGIERIEVDLRGLIDEGDPTKDVIVYPGDVVIIGSEKTDVTSDNYVWVSGAVKQPARLDWVPGLTVSQAITQVGGVSDIAAPNRTRIKRQLQNGTTETIRARLKDIERGREPDILLKPGDQINVRESIF